MTEYEQLQQLLTALGIPHTATIVANPTTQPAQQIDIAGVELWFNSRGQFLKVYESGYDDHLIEEQRTLAPGFVLEEDDVVLHNAAIAEQAYQEKKQREHTAQAQHDHERAIRMAAYRQTHPLLLPGHARQTLNRQAWKLLESGGAATLEQAINCIAQQDGKLFQLVLDEEAEARANIQSLGYPTWKKTDFIPPPNQEPAR